jgi:hypothetical protein
MKDTAAVQDKPKEEVRASESNFKFEGYALPGASVGDTKSGIAGGSAKDALPDMTNQLATLRMAQADVTNGNGKKDVQEQPAANDRSADKRVEIFNRGASPAFAQEVADGTAHLPQKVSEDLRAKGIKVEVFKDIHAYDRAHGTQHGKSVPGSRNLALDAPSLYEGSGKPPVIAVFERLGDGTPVKSQKNIDVGGLALHEAGHAWSTGRGYLTMQDKNFQAAMIKDVDNLTPAQLNQLKKEVQPGGPMAYYLSTPSKEEFFAEAFATASGRPSDKIAGDRLNRMFPNVLKYMKDSTR